MGGGGWWVGGGRWVVAPQTCGQNPSTGIRSPPGPADAHDARSWGPTGLRTESVHRNSPSSRRTRTATPRCAEARIGDGPATTPR